MFSLRSLALPLLGLTLLAAPAIAQTAPAPTTSVTKMPARKVTHHTTSTIADPRRGSGSNDNGKGTGEYAAPGEPINVQSNGKGTPPYDGPAAGHGATGKGMTMPRSKQ